MIVTSTLLFLLGTSVFAEPLLPSLPTEIIIEKHELKDRDFIRPSVQSPFISNYIQKGTNVFFKPQFMLSSAEMPPQVQSLIEAIEKSDCKTTILEEPLRIVEKEFTKPPKTNIKEVIEIRPAEFGTPIVESFIPSAPVEVIATYRPVQGTENDIEIKPIEIPEAPVLPPYVPEIAVEVVENPTEIVLPLIPTAPVLPALEIPRLPTIENTITLESVAPSVPLVIEKESPKDTINTIIIPPAPVLSPFAMSNLPVLNEEPKIVLEPLAPIAPVVVESVEPQISSQPIAVPPAPVLPPLEIPCLPVLIEESPSDEKAAPVMEEEKPAHTNNPIVIPPAPVLPPFERPELPVMVEEVSVAPAFVPEVIVEEHYTIPEAPLFHPLELPANPVSFEDVKPILIPQPPVLPPFSMPQLPVPILIEEHEISIVTEKHSDSLSAIEVVEPQAIPEAPVLPPMPTNEIPAPVVIEEPVIIVTENEYSKPVIIPPAPVLPPLDLPKIYETLPVVEIKEVFKPQIIPEAPVLPTMPAIELPAPVVIEEPKNIETEREYVKPAIIPPAPVLPSLDLPKVSVLVEDSDKVSPCPENEAIKGSSIIVEPRPIFIPLPVAFHQTSNRPVDIISVPTAPIVPEWLIPFIPGFNQNKGSENAVLSPTDCVHNIVEQRILPKMKKASKCISYSPSNLLPTANL